MSKTGVGNCLVWFNLPAGVCQSTGINCTLGSSRLSVDGHRDLSRFLPSPLPASLQEITALLLGTVEQKVRPSLSCSAWLTGANLSLFLV